MTRFSFRRFREIVPFIFMATLAIVPPVHSGHIASESHVLSRVSLIQQQILRLEEFVDSDADGFTTLRRSEAAEAGYSLEILDLAQEMADFQNHLLYSAIVNGTQDLSTLSLKATDFPTLGKFAKLIHQANRHKRLHAEGPELGLRSFWSSPCGAFSMPIPASTPPWQSYSSATPLADLLALGFHETAVYARRPGTVDYTRGQSFGSCASPIFRNHAIITSTGYRIQAIEPNPEVFTYMWPYWVWPLYAYWWHEVY